MNELKTIAPLSNFKRSIAQIYNAINQEIFCVGVKQQKIEFYDEKILIFGTHKRVPALKAISVTQPQLIMLVDAALINEYKKRLKEEMEKLLHLDIRLILQDYDTETETACTIVYLNEEMVTV